MNRDNCVPMLKNSGLLFKVMCILTIALIALSFSNKSKAESLDKQLACLAQNVYWEAATEPFEGKIAVAQVTLNRVRSGRFPNSICGVVQQKTTVLDKIVCQFSWFCEPRRKPIVGPLYEESMDVARMVLQEGYELDHMKDAMYFHAVHVNPRWNKQRVGRIGRHIFYRDKTKVVKGEEI